MRDLKSTNAIKLKGALFAGIGILSLALLWLRAPEWENIALSLVAVWAFCRFYYFAFYVIQRYVEPQFRFSGLLDFFKYCLKRKR